MRKSQILVSLICGLGLLGSSAFTQESLPSEPYGRLLNGQLLFVDVRPASFPRPTQTFGFYVACDSEDLEINDYLTSPDLSEGQIRDWVLTMSVENGVFKHKGIQYGCQDSGYWVRASDPEQLKKFLTFDGDAVLAFSLRNDQSQGVKVPTLDVCTGLVVCAEVALDPTNIRVINENKDYLAEKIVAVKQGTAISPLLFDGKLSSTTLDFALPFTVWLKDRNNQGWIRVDVDFSQSYVFWQSTKEEPK